MKKKTNKAVQVSIIMGSDSDFAKMKDAQKCLLKFGIACEVKVVSAHRTAKAMLEFAENAASRGVQVIIAGAGGAAHLPGMVASVTSLPVIGVPINITKLNGLDSLLSIVQMPKGVPVACMAVDNSYNAGLLAARILALHCPDLSRKLERFQSQMQKKVRIANLKVKKSLRP